MDTPAHDVDEILFSRESIHARVEAIVDEIAEGFRGDPLVLIGILRGSFIFLADLVRSLYRHRIPAVVDFMTLESYGAGTASSGKVRLIKDVEIDVADKQVLLVDDILDSGRTLSFAADHLRQRGASEVHTCVLLDKTARRVVPCEADHVGFSVEDAFVVGYGLDYAGRYRELPHIARVTFKDPAPDTSESARTPTDGHG